MFPTKVNKAKLFFLNRWLVNHKVAVAEVPETTAYTRMYFVGFQNESISLRGHAVRRCARHSLCLCSSTIYCVRYVTILFVLHIKRSKVNCVLFYILNHNTDRLKWFLCSQRVMHIRCYKTIILDIIYERLWYIQSGRHTQPSMVFFPFKKALNWMFILS